jgi:hypothetical protein
MSYRRFKMPENLGYSAKVAKVAKLPDAADETLAKLATLAGGSRQPQIFEPACFSDLWETEGDYARALIRYAGQGGLSLIVHDGRLIIAVDRKSDPDLLGELRAYEHAVMAVLATEPAQSCRPPIVAVPPYGVDHVPDRFRAAWESLLAECPPGTRTATWQTAINDAADLFSHWGQQFENYGWLDADIFSHLHGLAWFMRGSPVVIIGRSMAQCQDGRFWRRASRNT